MAVRGVKMIEGARKLRLALRNFSNEMLTAIRRDIEDGMYTQANDEDYAEWMAGSFPETLAALLKLPDFKDNPERADAYLCGYYRGLRAAAVASVPRAKRQSKRPKEADALKAAQAARWEIVK